MATADPIRWGAIGFMLSDLMWFVLGFSAMLGYLQAIPGREDVVQFLIAHLLLAAGLVGLHALQKGNYGILVRASPWPRSRPAPWARRFSWRGALPSSRSLFLAL